ITEGNNLTAIINETAAYYAVMAKPESLAVEIGDKKAKTVEGKGRINKGYIYKSDKYIKITAEPGTRLANTRYKGKACVKAAVEDPTGLFGIKLIDKAINLEDFSHICFDYQIPEDVHVDILLKSNGCWYNIGMTDEPKTYYRINIKPIGEIKIIQDNKWHHAKFDIKKAISKFTNCTEIEELVIADWDSTGYLELRPGRNEKDKYFYMANIELNRYNDRKREDKNPGLWEIGIEDNDAGEFVFEKDAEKDYNIGQPYDRYARAITPGEPTSKINFNLTAEQAKRYYRLIIKAISVDTSKKGYVKFAVLLNDNKLAEYNASYWQGQRFNIPMHEHLQTGRNTVSLEWLDGGDWISWDYLEFIQDN
ncbi:MAG: polysaccharide lyase family protein, partial [Candidatus Omnitrophota bacterium]